MENNEPQDDDWVEDHGLWEPQRIRRQRLEMGVMSPRLELQSSLLHPRRWSYRWWQMIVNCFWQHEVQRSMQMWHSVLGWVHPVVFVGHVQVARTRAEAVANSSRMDMWIAMQRQAYAQAVWSCPKVVQYVHCPVRKDHKMAMDEYPNLMGNENFDSVFEYSEFGDEVSRFQYGEDQVQGIHGNCFVDLEHDNLDYYVECGGVANLLTFKELIRTFHVHPSNWNADDVLLSLCGRKNCMAIGHYRLVSKAEFQIRDRCGGCVECGRCGRTIQEYCQHDQLRIEPPFGWKCSHVHYSVCGPCILDGTDGFDGNKVAGVFDSENA